MMIKIEKQEFLELQGICRQHMVFAKIWTKLKFYFELKFLAGTRLRR